MSEQPERKEFSDRIEYQLNGKFHREDGPAIEWVYGTKIWYVDGKRHRLDGPALEVANGGKSWWVDGKCHRLDGPALEVANGGKEWYISGNQVSKSDVDSFRLKTLTLSFIVNRRIWKKTL